MKDENTKIIAAFLVPVLLIAGVVGYQLHQDEELQPIDVDEGFAEMTVEYQKHGGWEYQLTSTATTYVNDNSSLEFDVKVVTVIKRSPGHSIYIKYDSDGFFEDDLSPETLEFRARGLDGVNVSLNDYFFFPERGTYEGCNLWTGGYNGYGRGMDTGVVGLNIEQNNFSVRGAELDWHIPPSNFGNPYTLEIQAVVGGLSEEVVATVHVHIDLFSKIESFEASIDKEHYLTSDYPEGEEDAYWFIYPEITYKFDNLPGGEDVLYDVEIYAIGSQDYIHWREVGIFSDTDKHANEYHEATAQLQFWDRHAEFEVLEFELRFVIISQESNWVYDSYEDSEFDMTFTVTHDGGGEE